jgi:hypothetical protein
METIGKETQEQGLLNQGDLALAAYSLAQLHNAYLDSLERGDYEGEMTKEQMEASIRSIHMAHTKFDAIIRSMQKDGETQQSETTED